jgi:hypothetical protein
MSLHPKIYKSKFFFYVNFAINYIEKLKLLRINTTTFLLIFFSITKLFIKSSVTRKFYLLFMVSFSTKYGCIRWNSAFTISLIPFVSTVAL